MEIDLAVVAEGLSNALTVTNLLWMTVGVTLGLVAGTLPGLGGGTMMAILLPIAVTLPLDTMLITLAAIYAANVYADSTTGILYNIPGGAAGVPATLEGYKLKQKGRVQEAISAQIGASLYGACFGFVALLLLVPVFIYFVRFFGSAERALLAVWALVFIATGVFSKEDPLRAFLSVGFGLALALIGQQPNIGTFRFTLGLQELWDGLKVSLLVLGLFALPQLLEMGGVGRTLAVQGQSQERLSFLSIYRMMGGIVWSARGILARASGLGVIIGVIPGVGTSTASWIGYSVARKRTRQPEPMGTGNRDGIAGAESASNACEVGTIIPLLALGIPGSAAAGIMLAALNMVNINPGPGMYATHGAQVWTVMFGIGLSGLVFALLAYPFIKAAQSMSLLPVSALIAAIGAYCVMGGYFESNSAFGIFAMIVIGLGMMGLAWLGLKPAPLLIGFVLGPAIEKEIIRAYQIRGVSRFFEPTALPILSVILLTLGFALFAAWRARSSAPRVATPVVAVEFVKEKAVALLGLAVAATVLIVSLRYPLFAAIWPWFIALSFIMVPALALLLRGLGGWREAVAGVRLASFVTADRRGLMEQAVLVALFALYALLADPIGFVLATVAFVFLTVAYFERRPLYALVTGLVVAGSIWGVTQAFGLYLPEGPLGF